MIISHENRYIFVELPQTGSTAVSKELQDKYGGKRILKKHATYRDFLRQATSEEASYFAFAGIRNPMDKLVSLYFKYKYDHRNTGRGHFFKDSNALLKWHMQRQFDFVHGLGADFPSYFLRYYHLPYDDWSSLDHSRMNFIIRFESLSEDFTSLLHQLGIPPLRPLPLMNKTSDRELDFWSYYPREVRSRARWVFGPYFRRWGYKFPADWEQDLPFASGLACGLANFPRRFYWRYLR
jgi:Sulfotransferase family